MAKKKTSSGSKKKDYSVNKKPDSKVGTLGKPSRKNLKFTADWKVPKHATDSKNRARANKVHVEWKVAWSGHWKSGTTAKQKKKGKKNNKQWVKGGSTVVRSKTFAISHTSDSVTLSRDQFYPKKANRKVSSVTVSVTLMNAKGSGKAVSGTYSVEDPGDPSISAEYDETTGTVKFTVNASNDAGAKERYDTVWEVYESDVNGKNFAKKKSSNPSFTGASASPTFDVTDRAALTNSQIRIVRCKAWCRGIGGASGTASRDYSVGYPLTAAVKTVKGKASYKLTGTNDDDRIIFYLVQSAKTDPLTGKAIQKASAHKATKMQLEVQKNSDAANAADANKAGSSWEEVSGSYATDDNEATALVDYVSNARPDRGAHVWYRIRSEKDGLAVYSDPVEVTQLYVPPVATDKATCAIVGIENGYGGVEDGTSATVTVGWNAKDEMTGTELSWSTDAGAWDSTAGPSTYRFTDSAGASGSWTASRTVKLSGLTAGEIVYVRARRYLEEGGETTPGPYCEQKSVLVCTAPDQVTATAPEWVERGSGARVAWTHSGGGTQAAWEVVYEEGGGASLVVAAGSGAAGSVVLAAETLEAMASDDVASLKVGVSTGGRYVYSEAVSIGIADPPSIAIGMIESITAQPVTVQLAGSHCSGSRVIIGVEAVGASGEGPGGDWFQPDGVSLYTGVFEPAWTEQDDGSWAMAAELPHIDGLHDKAGYRITAVATDASTGMAGAADPVEAAVAWAHQASAPSDSSAVEDYYDDETGDRFCEVRPVAPSDAAEGDVCDIYRVTPLGADLIAVGVAFGQTYTDPWAPFSASRQGAGYDAVTGERLDADDLPETEADLRYRLATRTSDGDEEWRDVEYDAVCPRIRIDWPSGYIELPWNPDVQIQADKGTEVRSYMDGGRDGFWPAEAGVSGSIRTDLIRLGTPAQTERLMEAAQYQGACFVRIPDGNAFAADVQLGSVQEDHDGALKAASLSFTKLRLPDAYKIQAAVVDETVAELDESEG